MCESRRQCILPFPPYSHVRWRWPHALKLDPKLGRLHRIAPEEDDAVADQRRGAQVRDGFDTIQRGCDKFVAAGPWRHLSDTLSEQRI
ncbi:unnamed protein product [Urochloa humidicola]